MLRETVLNEVCGTQTQIKSIVPPILQHGATCHP